jgi:hypothetical protein
LENSFGGPWNYLLKAGPFVGSLKAGLLSADQEFDLIKAASFFIQSDVPFGCI